MYGWRARIGLLIAASNTTMEPEFNRVAPPGVSVHAARVRVGGISLDGARMARQDIGRAVEELVMVGPAAFGYACTIANFASGSEDDLAQGREISEKTGVPAVTAGTAVIEAVHALGARRIAVATPYPDDADATAKQLFEACGIEVVAIGGTSALSGARKPHNPLSAMPVSQVGLQPPEFAYRLARSVYVKGVDAVAILGANLRTQEAIPVLEADLGVPVVTSTQATIWAALQLAGVMEPMPGRGRLLAEALPLKWARLPRPKA